MPVSDLLQILRSETAPGLRGPLLPESELSVAARNTGMLHRGRQPGEGELEMNQRYSLVPPIHGGEQFWDINDEQRQFAIISIHVSFPDAEKLAKECFRKLGGIYEQG